jgi:hypothetical protein
LAKNPPSRSAKNNNFNFSLILSMLVGGHNFVHARVGSLRLLDVELGVVVYVDDDDILVRDLNTPDKSM